LGGIFPDIPPVATALVLGLVMVTVMCPMGPPLVGSQQHGSDEPTGGSELTAQSRERLVDILP